VGDAHDAAGGGYAQSVNADRSRAELYNPETDTWSFAGDMARARRNHAAIALPSGEAIIIGGHGGTQLDSTEIYTPCEG
jgi:hypothetical protein